MNPRLISYGFDSFSSKRAETNVEKLERIKRELAAAEVRKKNADSSILALGSVLKAVEADIAAEDRAAAMKQVEALLAPLTPAEILNTVTNIKKALGK